MLKILIAVDGSEHALRAVEAVAKIAGSGTPTQATLICVRTGAVLEPLFTNDYSLITVKKLDTEQETQQTAALNKATQLAEAHGLALTDPVRAYGNVAHEIGRVATERQMDLIAMGTHGWGALGNLLLGSVAQKVLHQATVPVLLVK